MADLVGIDLPASVRGRIELSPMEDIFLHILRRDFPDIPIHSLIPPEVVFPFVLIGRRAPLENWSGHPRFIDQGRMLVSVFTEEPNGIEKAQLISEGIRVALRDAWLRHEYVPGLGSIVRIELKSEPSRSPDWATSSGPVQFADLPNAVHRYEATYSVRIRRPRT